MKIGAVPFLNAKPLVYGLDVKFAQPSVLKKILESGDVQVALLSSVELLRNPKYKHVDGIGISSRGPIDSVRLYFRRTPIRRLALDPSSLSGNCLAQIIVAKKYGKKPQVFSHTGSFPADADGAVVIGDASFRFSDLSFMDLSSEWLSLTGKPFVYALWIYQKDIDSNILLNAKREGIANLAVIAEKESCRLGMDKDFCLGYLRNINYDLGKEELEGLHEFRNLASNAEIL